MKFYLDTSIWLDIHLSRGINGEKAKEMMRKIIENDYVVCYSDLIITELKNFGFSKYEIAGILRTVSFDNLRRIHIFKEQRDEARILCKKRKIPLADVFHAVIARDNYSVIITRDKHFEKIKDIVETIVPDDLIKSL